MPRRRPPSSSFLCANCRSAADFSWLQASNRRCSFSKISISPPKKLNGSRARDVSRNRSLEHLSDFRFTGDVHAVPEGRIFFANEPILRITAPMPQAQLVETRLINLLHFQTLIASKAARMVLAAPGKLMVDFGLRRAHGAEAGLLAARASYIAGFAGTATIWLSRPSAFRPTERWRTHLLRPTTAKSPHSKVSPSPGQKIHAAHRHLRYRGSCAKSRCTGAAACRQRDHRRSSTAR